MHDGVEGCRDVEGDVPMDDLEHNFVCVHINDLPFLPFSFLQFELKSKNSIPTMDVKLNLIKNLTFFTAPSRAPRLSMLVA